MTDPQTVAVVSTSMELARFAARACESGGLRAAVADVVEASTGHGALACAVDAAARSDAAAVLIVVDSIRGHNELAPVCQAASPHIPIVAVTPPLAQDPWVAGWLDAIGVVVAPTLSSAVDRIRFLCALDPPVGNRCCVVGEHDAATPLVAAAAESAGFEVTRAVGVEAMMGALSDLSGDLVIVIIDSLDTAERFARRRVEHQELPVVAVVNANPEDYASLAAALRLVGVVVAAPHTDIRAGLEGLIAWGAIRGRAPTVRRSSGDPARLRRVAHALRGRTPTAYGLEHQRELAAGLGLPFARTRTVAYLEDALIAAAEIGYPVRVAAVYGGLRWPDFPQWRAIRSSAELLEVGERQLAAVARALATRAELAVAQHVDGAEDVVAQAAVHPEYGVVVSIESDERVVHVVPPVTADALRAAFEGGRVSGAVLRVAVEVASAVVSALHEIDDLEVVSVAVEAAAVGALCKHVCVGFRSTNEQENVE